MKYPYYDMSVPVFIMTLKSLKNVLAKGEAHAKSHEVKDEALLNSRIIVDMFPLVKQVQIACDNAKGAAGRLAQVEIPKMADEEKTFAELYTRIDKTLKFLESVKPEQFEKGAEIKAVFPYTPDKHILGKDYLPNYALPNFFFHITTAYNILRANGVTLGKTDYIGGVPFHDN